MGSHGATTAEVKRLSGEGASSALGSRRADVNDGGAARGASAGMALAGAAGQWATEVERHGNTGPGALVRTAAGEGIGRAVELQGARKGDAGRAAPRHRAAWRACARGDNDESRQW